MNSTQVSHWSLQTNKLYMIFLYIKKNQKKFCKKWFSLALGKFLNLINLFSTLSADQATISFFNVFPF